MACVGLPGAGRGSPALETPGPHFHDVGVHFRGFKAPPLGPLVLAAPGEPHGSPRKRGLSINNLCLFGRVDVGNVC